MTPINKRSMLSMFPTLGDRVILVCPFDFQPWKTLSYLQLRVPDPLLLVWIRSFQALLARALIFNLATMAFQIANS